ncbi:hypothetical protein PR048_022865 [Dryococelus australis]|uniref:DUF4371 domain-containing protein n=1 Tax=Dryococelus australis TaxID=614101 RepID=A0ABQ9GSF6_9NEOP|nr:hypothetical protein PR048_022865 [Dryococelus australis]
MVHAIMRDIGDRVRDAGIYSVMIDENTDISDVQQFSVNPRFEKKKNLVPEELFIGLYSTKDITSRTQAEIILDALKRLNLPIELLRGQCCDGGLNMKGEFKGSQARIRGIQALALHVHCAAHSLQLVLKDVIKCIPAAREALQWTNDVGVVVNASPKRKLFQKTFGKQKKKLAWGRQCCVLQDGLRINDDEYKINISAKARGLHDQLEKGSIYFMLIVLRIIFTICEDLSKVLQSSTCSVAGAKCAISMTLKTLEKMRTDKKLKVNLSSLEGICSGCKTVDKIAAVFSKLRKEIRGNLFRSVENLSMLLLVVSASFSSAERSFSTMRRLKNYLRATMKQVRLNYVSVLHEHKEKVDDPCVSNLMREFINNEYRFKVFGTVE